MKILLNIKRGNNGVDDDDDDNVHLGAQGLGRSRMAGKRMMALLMMVLRIMFTLG